eukprot:c15300_g3_i1.p1 GENE.c15300_g3_i1~~c15300_g3_i1.p1  ORF type:complete len:395 (+),score=155.46 c15300_g3_i1:25-1185(+)
MFHSIVRSTVLFLIVNELLINAKYTRISKKPSSKESNTPKTLKSDEFEQIPHTEPPKPSYPDISSLLDQFDLGDLKVISASLGKSSTTKNQEKKIKNAESIETDSNSNSVSDVSSDISWIDSIESDEGLSILQKDLESQISVLEKKLEKVKSARAKQNSSKHKPIHNLLKKLKAKDITKNLFGDNAEDIEDLGVSVSVLDSDDIVKFLSGSTDSIGESESLLEQFGHFTESLDEDEDEYEDEDEESSIKKPIRSVSVDLNGLINRINEKFANNNNNNEEDNQGLEDLLGEGVNSHSIKNQIQGVRKLEEMIKSVSKKSEKLIEDLKKSGISQKDIDEANKVASELAQKMLSSPKGKEKMNQTIKQLMDALTNKKSQKNGNQKGITK